MNKLLAYYYQIVEIYPVDHGNGFTVLHQFDNIEDTQKIINALESVNYDFTCYGIMLHPVWDNERERVEERKKRREDFQNKFLKDDKFP